MGKKGFNRKKAVRFVLVPGPQKDGKPTVLFKPVETRKTQVSKKQRKEVISKLGDYEQITINGKPVDEHDIPAFVLEQIKGRGNLVYNQMHHEEQEEEVGDMYQIQDAKEEDEPGYQDEQHNYQEEEKIYEQEEDEDWEDQEEDGEEEDADYQQEIIEQIEQKYIAKEEDFPQLAAVQKVEIEGKEYSLTKAQIQMLDTIIPQNYEQMDFGGLRFKKYNQDGLLLSEKEKYERYLLGDNQKVVVVDTYEYVPAHAVNTVDNDLKPSQITKDLNIKALEDALNYEGEEEVYEQLEDDFFAKMIKGQLEVKKQKKVQEKPAKTQVPKSVQPKSQVVAINSKIVQKELDEQLQSAIFNYDHNLQQHKEKDKFKEEDSEESEEEKESNTNLSMNFTDIQKRQGYLGKDGELDWRMLTKKEKKEYMKTKVIREYYDELRQREIEEKMKGISNVRPEELHLKQLVKHITYDEDHVMQKALAEDLKKQVHLSDQDEGQFESVSDDDDDIVSFHQKTSIIASNLSVIEEPKKKKTATKKKEEEEQPVEHDMTKIKIIPEQRDRNQTKQQRQQRKKKLKELKKQRRQQRGQFVQKFNKQKKETMKRQNANNPLSKVSLVKIY